MSVEVEERSPVKMAHENRSGGPTGNRSKLVFRVANSKDSDSLSGSAVTRSHIHRFVGNEGDVANSCSPARNLRKLAYSTSHDVIEKENLRSGIVPPSKDVKFQEESSQSDPLSLLSDAACLTLGLATKASTVSAVSEEQESEIASEDPGIGNEVPEDTGGHGRPSNDAEGISDDDCVLTLGRPAAHSEGSLREFNKNRGISLSESAAFSKKDYRFLERPRTAAYGERVRDMDGVISESGSSTDHSGYAESLAKWKTMKQNGFISSQFGAPLHRRVETLRKWPAMKKHKPDLKKNTEVGKKEQVSRFKMLAAPSGFLKTLNPGIINHVRNYKQVKSIIEAVVKSENLDKAQAKNAEPTVAGNRKERKRSSDLMHDPEFKFNESSRSLNYSNNIEESFRTWSNESMNMAPWMFLGMSSELDHADKRARIEEYIDSQCDVDYEKVALLSKIQPQTFPTAEDASRRNEQLTTQAALIAHQWLEVLYQDYRGRLMALRRSQKRIQTKVHNELPFLLSIGISSGKENQHSAACSNNGLGKDDHIVKWRSIFDHMDKVLLEEGRLLESYMTKVKEMQSYCSHGLQGMGLKSVDDVSGNGSRPMNLDAKDVDFFVGAAAASIHSTFCFAESKGTTTHPSS